MTVLAPSAAMALLAALALACAAPGAVRADPPCARAAPGVEGAEPPRSWWAFHRDFEARVRLAFPVGSDEARLRDWMAAMGFDEPSLSPFDAFFSGEPREVDRYLQRSETGERVKLSGMTRWCILGRSHFSVGWNADECGRITELWPDTEICHIDIP